MCDHGSIDHLLIAAANSNAKFHGRATPLAGFSAQDARAGMTPSRLNGARTSPTDGDRHCPAPRRFDRSRCDVLRHPRSRVSARDRPGRLTRGDSPADLFDLFGFFPGSFVGNPSLKPESSRGFEVSARLRRDTWGARLAYFRQRLRDEIVDVFDPATFESSTVNTTSMSRRSGIEVEADWAPSEALRVTANYAWLDARQGDVASSPAREVRRPRQSGSIAVDGQRERLSYGASIAYSGERFDTDFDQFPAARVRFEPYWKAGARVAYRVHRGIELFGRIANALDADVREVVGYRTEGRSAFAGVRIAVGR